MGHAGDLRCRRRCRIGVPADTDGITLEWLTAALHQAGALDQARVTSLQSAPIGRFGFTGQIRRLQIGYDKPEPCAPRSLVAKFSAAHPEARAAVHSLGFYEREIGFYRELAADCPVRTPRCYFGEVQMDSGASLLLLEVEGSDSTLTYRAQSIDVLSKNEVARDAEEIFAQTGAGRLVLITCDDWDGTAWRSNIITIAAPA